MGAYFKILHADDDRVARVVLARHAAKEPDCEVIEARTGAEAWQFLEAGVQPDLCVFDIVMPELDGLSLLRRMRADFRFAKMPVILCTAVQDRATIAEAADLTIDYYMVKPFSEELAREQIRRVRQEHRHTDEDESVSAFCARAGMDPATGQELLGAFAQEIQDMAEVVKKSLAQLNFDAAARSIRSLKVTANCLCLGSAFLELARVEKIVASASFTASSSDAPADVAPAVFRLWQIAAGRRGCCVAVEPGLSRLQQMATRWAASPEAASAEVPGCPTEASPVQTGGEPTA